MPLVAAICTQCGSKLDVDSSRECTVCPFCNTPFVTEKAINNYNTTNVTNIGNLHADVINVQDTHSIDNKVKSGDTFIKLGDYDSAWKVFSGLTKDCPYDYRGWLGCIRCDTKKYSITDVDKYLFEDIKEYYEKACTVAEPDQIEIINQECKEYIDKAEERIGEILKNTYIQLDELESKRKAYNLENEKKIAEVKATKLPFNARIVAYPVLIIAVIIIAFISYKTTDLWLCCGITLISGLIAFLIGKLVNKITTTATAKTIKEINRKVDILNGERRIFNSSIEEQVRVLNTTFEKYKISNYFDYKPDLPDQEYSEYGIEILSTNGNLDAIKKAICDYLVNNEEWTLDGANEIIEEELDEDDLTGFLGLNISSKTNAEALCNTLIGFGAEVNVEGYNL